MSWLLEDAPKVVEKLLGGTLEIVEWNAEAEDAVLELAGEEASTNAAVADLEVEEDSSVVAGFGEEEDTTVEREELLVEGTSAAVEEEHSAAVAALVEGIRCCHLVEELFPALVVHSL